MRHWQEWAERHGLDLSQIMQVAHGLRSGDTMRLVAPRPGYRGRREAVHGDGRDRPRGGDRHRWGAPAIGGAAGRALGDCDLR